MTKEERATRKKYESKDAMKIFAKWYLENKANLLQSLKFCIVGYKYLDKKQ